MQPKQIPLNKHFVGRHFEREKLAGIAGTNQPAIIIVYGRRRVGKTELLEQTFRTHNILKFEGKEQQSEPQQMKQVLMTLSKYANEPLLAKLEPTHWQEVFEIIHRYTTEGTWTIYFEEVQWLANYNDDFISELKYAWDNYFRYNQRLIVILCGSAPSFMINHVAHSKALYNRSQHEIGLGAFTLIETKEYLKKSSPREVMDAYLTVGGIPLYLEKLTQESSVFLSLCKNSFTKNSFFSGEYERIFISSMSNNPHYKKIISFLSKRHYATRNDILKHLKLSSGSNITALLQDLEQCGFISKYTPYNLADDSMLSRYAISDPYLQFYYKFISPIKKHIQEGKFNRVPRSAIKMETYVKWQGFAFERFCRRFHYIIADILKFSAVHYRSGVYFSRKTAAEDPGFQIDLLFDRDDHVIAICEIKYSQNKVPTSIITAFEKKLQYFPNPKNKTIQRVLIAANGVEDNLKNLAYFDNIITLDNLFNVEHY